MSITKAITRTIKRNIASEPNYPEDVRAEAERIAHQTTLSGAEALVVAGDSADLPDNVIDRAIVYSGKSVRDIRRGLRAKKLDLSDELTEKQRAKEAISAWSESG